MELPSKHFFTPAEVAEILDVPRHHVYRMVRQQRIKAQHFGPRIIRIAKEEVERITRQQ